MWTAVVALVVGRKAMSIRRMETVRNRDAGGASGSYACASIVARILCSATMRFAWVHCSGTWGFGT